MIKLNSKGQGAMEYLINYSWAILIVLVVGVVLYQMGIFNQGQGAVITTGFPQLKPVPQAVSYQQNGTFQSAFLNTYGTAIQVDGIAMQDTIAGTDCIPVSPAAGESTSVKAGDALAVVMACSTKQSREGYNVYVSLNYSVALEDKTEHTENGYIQGQAE